MSVERRRWIAATVVATLGTLPPSLLIGAALARWLPFEEGTRLSIGFVVTLPLWAILVCVSFLDARVWRAALSSALVSGLLVALFALARR